MIEEVSKDFNLDLFLEARNKTINAVALIASRCFEGMSENDGLNIIDETLRELGSQKKWHPNKFRIGVNTTKSFRDQSVEGVRLEENDYFFIDIGPVFNGYEGDYGKTFKLGNSSDINCIVSENIFNELKIAWLEERLSGEDLYVKAQKLAHKNGYKLEERMAGHRLSDFPHALYYKGSLKDFDKIPLNNIWVLEILVIDNKIQRGSFFEDILYS